MEDSEMLEMLKTLTGESDEDLLTIYLNLAKQGVLARLYPFKSDETEIPDKYTYLTIEIAQYLYNKRGAEGETAHNENGVNRTYESASIPDSMLKKVTPFCGVME